MIFVIESSSKPYWSFKYNIKLIKDIYISKTNFILIKKLTCFILINSRIIRLKKIEANYFYVYSKNFN